MPAFVAVGVRAQSASAATLTPAKPTGADTNGLMLAIVTSKNNATHSCATGGWSLVGQVNSGASFTASLWRAKGNAAAPVVTWTGAAACSAQIAYYDDPANVVDNATYAFTNSNGTANPHTSASILATRNGACMAYIDVAAANTALATPSGWTENADAGSATDAGRTVWGSKAVALAGSGSGAISVTGAAAAWVQWQVEILGEQPPVAFQTSKAEVGAWYDAPDNAASWSKVEVGAWLDAPDEASWSKVEVGAWLDPAPEPEGGRRRQILNVN